MSKRRGIDVLGVASAVILASCALAIVASALAAELRVSATAAVAAAAAATPLLVRSYARRVLGPRGPVFVAIAGLVTTPVLFIGAARMLAEPIIYDLRCGFDLFGLAVLAPVVLAIFGIPVAAALFGIVSGSERPRVDRGIAAAARLAIAAAVTLIALSAHRRIHNSEPRHYLAALPTVAEISPQSWQTASLAEVSGRAPNAPNPTRVLRYELPDGAALYLLCAADPNCVLAARSRGAERATPGEGYLSADADHLVQFDRTHDIYIIDRRLVVRSDRTVGYLLYPRDVRASLAAPRDWIIVAAFGVGVALLLLRVGRARARDAAAITWREGFVTGDGTVVFPDGMTLALHGPRQQALAEGMSVTVAESPVTPTFRAVPELHQRALRPGTLADREAEGRAEATTHAAWALLAVATTLSPLIACVVHRIAF